MPDNNLKKIIGWYNKSKDHFWCLDCFFKEFKEKQFNKKEFKKVKERDLEQDIFTCDKCGEILKRKTMSKTTKFFLIVVGSIVPFVLIVEILFPTPPQPLIPRSEIIAGICFDSCKWDSAHQAWKPNWVSKYFLTRSSCINWCKKNNE